MPRILHIIPTLDRAGAEKQLSLLAAGLPRDQFEVHVCCLTRGGPLVEELTDAGIPVHIIGKRWKADPLAFWRLRQHIAALKPDIVHTWLFAANAYGRAAAQACKVSHIIASERCVDRWKGGWQLTIDRRLNRYTDRIVVNSPATRDFYSAKGIPAEQFTLIANGVPEPPPCTTSRADLLTEFNLPDDARLIGAVGRLWPQKRVKDLIWAFDLLHLIHKNARLLVIGDGPQRAALERFVRLIEARGHTLMLGHREDVQQILPHLDVFWLGSEYEGQSNALLEAMAAGVPVVASDIPNNRELVVPNETGFLAPVGSRSGFTAATDNLLEDPALAQRLGQAGQRRVREQFSVAAMIEAHVALYRELLKSRA